MSDLRPGPTVRVRPLVVRDDAIAREDLVATEEPLEIRLRPAGEPERSIAITMRTPGDDFDLAVGFLYAEGVISDGEQIESVRYCVGGPQEQRFNVVTVGLRPGVTFDASRLSRHVYTNSSCGVCGKASLEALDMQDCTVVAQGPVLDEVVVRALPDRLREAQRVFARTGGLHAAGVFTADGDAVVVREDVGRHNAVDKTVGWLLTNGRIPASDAALVVSGRASFEIMQKALVARVPTVVAVGAPSSLAVDVAQRFGMTLAGFAGAGGFNVYAGPSRVRLAASRSSGVSTSSNASGGAT